MTRTPLRAVSARLDLAPYSGLSGFGDSGLKSEQLWGRNGNCRGPVARETGAILSLPRCGRGILTPPRRRAFCPPGGLGSRNRPLS
jgi:hypothetical protein